MHSHGRVGRYLDISSYSSSSSSSGVLDSYPPCVGGEGPPTHKRI